MEKTNNEKFADMLNACPDPQLFAEILLSLVKPCGENGQGKPTTRPLPILDIESAQIQTGGSHGEEQP